MINAILNALFPVIVIILLGYGLRRGSFFSEGFFRGLNKLTYWVGLPTLLFVKIGTASLVIGPVIRLSSVLLISTTIVTLISLLLAYRLPMPALSRGAFINSSFRGNLAFIGLPVITYGLDLFPEAVGAETLAIVCLGPIVVCFNLLAVPALLYTLPKELDGNSKRKIHWLKPLFQNPLIIASFLGLLVSGSGLHIPVFLERPLLIVGQVSLPLALIAIGAGLNREKLRGKVSWSILACGMKCVLMPAIGYIFCLLLELSRVETFIALLYLAMPTAVASYVLTQQLNGDEDLAGSSIVLSTVFSFIPLAFIIVCFS